MQVGATQLLPKEEMSVVPASNGCFWPECQSPNQFTVNFFLQLYWEEGRAVSINLMLQ